MLEIQMEYPQFDAPEWGKRIRTVMGDIVRNKRRRMFREARKENTHCTEITCIAGSQDCDNTSDDFMFLAIIPRMTSCSTKGPHARCLSRHNLRLGMYL